MKPREGSPPRNAERILDPSVGCFLALWKSPSSPLNRPQAPRSCRSLRILWFICTSMADNVRIKHGLILTLPEDMPMPRDGSSDDESSSEDNKKDSVVRPWRSYVSPTVLRRPASGRFPCFHTAHRAPLSSLWTGFVGCVNTIMLHLCY